MVPYGSNLLSVSVRQDLRVRVPLFNTTPMVIEGTGYLYDTLWKQSRR